MQNNLKQISVVLYRLKRQWGLQVKYYQLGKQTHNVETGDITREYTIITVRRAPVLPNMVDRHFVYDLAYIAASKNFTEGGYFERNQRTIIFDAKDLPRGFVPNGDDHVEFDEKRYEIKSIDHLEQRRGYLLTVAAIDNAETVG